jgi:hypothetical protein
MIAVTFAFAFAAAAQAAVMKGRTASTLRKPAPTVRTLSIRSLSLLPQNSMLVGARAAQTLVAMAAMGDGSVKDVTAECQFRSHNPKVATVNAQGVVTPVANGATVVTAQCGKTATSTKVVVKNIEDNTFNFTNHILPVISKLGCNRTGCHGSPKGKSGFKMSLFGAEPEPDFVAFAKSGEGRRINPADPAKSLFLLKATMTISHGGGKITEVGSPEYNTLAQWIARGAPRGKVTDPKVVGVEVLPKERSMKPNEKQQLIVAAKFSDGSTQDVTRLANYKVNDEVVATTSGDGKVTAQVSGEAVVMVEFLGKMDTARIAVPQNVTGSGFWVLGSGDGTPKPKTQNPEPSRIDDLVFAKLRKLGIPPSDLSGDTEFIRRVYLDVIGTLPTPDEVTRFIADPSPDKRSRLIEQLLNRPEFSDFWALKWGDILRVKRGFPIHLWDKGMWAYHRYIKESIAQNKPYDDFVRELLTANGSGYRDGAANFYRAVPSKDPQTWAETTATTFLGVRLDCAHCHNHPFESWTWDDNYGLAAFFKVGLKGTGEWGDEVVFFKPDSAVKHAQTGQAAYPKLLGGEEIGFAPNEDPRKKLAEWITSPKNPWFARNAVNRVWFWLLGRGIVHEPDDFRSTNPPENPELLDYLADEFVRHDFDMKHIFRLVLNSRTYQLSSKPNQWNEHDTKHFSHYAIKRLGAEQLLDALSQSADAPEKFPGLPLGYRAIQLPDSQVNSFFLDLFGRPPRDITCECERSTETSMPQALYLINSEHLEGKVSQGQRIKRLLAQGKSDDDIITELYLATLSRFPTQEERKKTITYLANKPQRERALQDVLWALLNTKEFMFNH